MRTRHVVLLTAGALYILSAGVAMATPVAGGQCASGTLADYISLGAAGGCSVGTASGSIWLDQAYGVADDSRLDVSIVGNTLSFLLTPARPTQTVLLLWQSSGGYISGEELSATFRDLTTPCTSTCYEVVWKSNDYYTQSLITAPAPTLVLTDENPPTIPASELVLRAYGNAGWVESVSGTITMLPTPEPSTALLTLLPALVFAGRGFAARRSR